MRAFDRSSSHARSRVNLSRIEVSTKEEMTIAIAKIESAFMAVIRWMAMGQGMLAKVRS